jgi:putative ABC transport system permease protein
MDAFRQDLHFALRQLRRSPGYAVAAAVTLALGIGANTAIFSLVDAALLRPLPFPDASRLVLLWESRPGSGFAQLPLSFPTFSDVREQAWSLEGLAAWTSQPETTFNLTLGEGPQPVQYALVTTNFFDVLGVAPTLGRSFGPAEAEPAAAPAVVLSHGLWSRLGADPSLVGRTLRLGDRAHAVIGVLPRGFRFVSAPREAELWLAIEQQPDPTQARRYARAARYLGAVGRLRPGVSVAAARAELAALSARFTAGDPGFYRDWALALVPLHEAAVAGLRPTVLVLLGAVSFVLLIACANVAGLALARGQARRGELAVRTALGASRSRVVRQLLTESALLGLLGGTLGLLVAFWGLDLLAALSFRTVGVFVPYTIDLRAAGLDSRVLLFTLAASLGTGVLFGILPALSASRAEPRAGLGAVGRPGEPSRGGRARRALTVAELALSVVLLVGAGLMLESFRRLQVVDPGFRPDDVLAADVRLPRFKYGQPPRVARFYEDLLGRLAGVPGVEGVGAVSALPLSGTDAATGVLVEGRPPGTPAERPSVHHRAVTPGYFGALGIALRRGRAFDARDDAQGPKVALVNQTLAARLWPGEDPLGKRLALDFEAMRFFRDRPPQLDLASGLREVVGVVADVRHSRLDAQPAPELYVPFAQRPSPDMTLVLRGAGGPAALASAARAALKALDPDQPLAGVTTVSALVETALAPSRFHLRLLGAFAALAFVLAAVGLYGVVAHSVARRTGEIGVRMALGAARRDVVAMVLREAAALSALGLALGGAAALALARALRSVLYAVSPADPAAYAAAAVALAAMTALASYLPARRATRVDPATALRNT